MYYVLFFIYADLSDRAVIRDQFVPNMDNLYNYCMYITVNVIMVLQDFVAKQVCILIL